MLRRQTEESLRLRRIFPERRGRKSSRLVCIFFPVSSTRMFTSTNRGVRIGKASRPARALWRRAAAPFFLDMPLNAHAPTLDAESFQLKLVAAQKNSLTDFALWGGLVPQNVDRLGELAACGVIGFKAFMSKSGIEDFSRADDATLREGMKRAAMLKLPVAVHAESETMTSALAQKRIAANKVSICDCLNLRPIAAELKAIRRAVDMAGETGCALHVVHVSSSDGFGSLLKRSYRA